MADSLTEQIRRNFDTMVKDQGLVLRTQRHFRQYQDLQNRCKDAKANEIRLHQEQYVMRVAAAHQRLIDKAGSKTKDYKHQWFGEDAFDKTKLMRRAQQQVAQQHKRRLTQIGQYEIRQTEHLLARTRRENRVHGKAEIDFNKAADRRQTEGRRSSDTASTSSSGLEQSSPDANRSQTATQPKPASRRVHRPRPRSR